MTSKLRIGKCFAGLGLALALAGCSSASSGLTTGSLLPSASKPADPVADRALQVGATSARAAKCGYNFDPAKLRSSYIAYEAGQEGAAAAKAEKLFDATRVSVGSKITDPSEYCSEDKTAEIKADLTRHLAGDYNPPNASKVWNIAIGIRSVNSAALVTFHAARTSSAYSQVGGLPGFNLNSTYTDGIEYTYFSAVIPVASLRTALTVSSMTPIPSRVARPSRKATSFSFSIW